MSIRETIKELWFEFRLAFVEEECRIHTNRDGEQSLICTKKLDGQVVITRDEKLTPNTLTRMR